MRDWKAIWKKWLFPPIWVMVILAIICTAALAFVFVKGWEESPIAYITYVLSFYALTTIVLGCWKTFPGYYKDAKSKVYGNKYANRYLTDKAFKTHVNLYRSLAINLLYVATNVVSAVIYHTSWFVIFAVYYTIMAFMRFLMVRYVNKNGIGKDQMGELKISRVCACFLMTINLALSGAVLMMVYFDRGFQYEGFLVYVVAMYTFYIATTAIIDMVKYRKLGSPIMSTTKIVKFASALISMLSLEAAMLSQFGTDSSDEMKQTMLIATGAGISIMILVMSVYMIVRNTKEIKKLKINNSQT